MEGWSVDGKLATVWAQEALVVLCYLSSSSLGGLRKPTKNLRIAGVPSEFEPRISRITLLTTTYVVTEYKGNALLLSHRRRVYTNAPRYVIRM
jgi:hypothetical protein